jgi:predicted dehydrogenase
MRLGILSFAHLHAESYIQNLRNIPDVELIGIADDDIERGRHEAEKFGARLFPSYAHLLAEKPDGVLVCSENAHHAALVEMAATAGVHVMCEKPLMTKLEDGMSMIDTCERAGVNLMTAFPMRFNVPVIEVKQLVDSGRLGRLYGFNTTNQGSCPGRWFVDKALAGGGAMMDHTVHVADLLRWILQSEAVEVYAQNNKILYSDEGDVDTGGLVMITFANGVFATIDCSWSRPRYYPVWGNVKLDVVGEGGLVTVNAFNQVINVYSDQTKRHTAAYWGSDADQAMVSEFVTSIRENRAPAVTGYDGYRAAEIALAAYRSAETGQPVRLPLE